MKRIDRILFLLDELEMELSELNIDAIEEELPLKVFNKIVSSQKWIGRIQKNINDIK